VLLEEEEETLVCGGYKSDSKERTGSHYFDCIVCFDRVSSPWQRIAENAVRGKELSNASYYEGKTGGRSPTCPIRQWFSRCDKRRGVDEATKMEIFQRAKSVSID